jgi:FKBP-type peptidyl-prolyl cis-trans isomerase
MQPIIYQGEPMNLKWLAIVIMLFAAASAGAQEPQPLQSQKEKISYAIGIDVARSYQSRKLDIDIELVIKAIRDVYSGGKPLLSDEEVRTTLTAYQKELMDKQAEAAKIAADKNKKEGEAFLAENKTKEGVVTTASGLQYKILKAGDGPKPTDESTVEVNYRGTLIDGTEFDSSYKTGKPIVFPVGKVISGWKEAIKLMPVGSKWQLFIPAELAYGARGAGRSIGPNATLIFEVELLSIKPPAEGNSPKPN